MFPEMIAPAVLFNENFLAEQIIYKLLTNAGSRWTGGQRFPNKQVTNGIIYVRGSHIASHEKDCRKGEQHRTRSHPESFKELRVTCNNAL